MSVQDLVGRARQGDEGAFYALMQHYEGLMMAEIRKYIGNLAGHDQDDLVQMVALKLWTYRVRFSDDEQQLAGYIAMTTKHLCIDLLRKTDPTPTTDEAVFTMLSDASAADRPDIFLQDVLHQAIHRLPQPHQDALWYYVQGFSYHEISQLLRIPMGTVSTWLSRAKEELRAVLQTQGVLA